MQRIQIITSKYTVLMGVILIVITLVGAVLAGIVWLMPVGGVDARTVRIAIPALYGNNAYHPLIQDDTVHIPTPNGALVSRDDGIRYVITDHLESGRVAHDMGITRYDEYDPFGSPVTGNLSSYIGEIFDNHDGTYQLVARHYDPTLAGFLSADPKRRGANPYSYADLNPINLVDPDGRAPIHFFFYSRYGTEVPDRTGRTSLRESMGRLTAYSRTLPETVIVAVLEDDSPIGIPEGEISSSHMTIISHGLPGSFSVISPRTGRRTHITGEEFSGYFYTGCIGFLGTMQPALPRGRAQWAFSLVSERAGGHQTPGIRIRSPKILLASPGYIFQI